MLPKISIGWIWLERTLNGIIDQVNQQKPLQSASIALEESPNGTLFKVVTPIDETKAGAKSVWPVGVGWQQLAVIDNSSGACVTKYLWYWGTQAGPSTQPPANPT